MIVTGWGCNHAGDAARYLLLLPSCICHLHPRLLYLPECSLPPFDRLESILDLNELAAGAERREAKVGAGHGGGGCEGGIGVGMEVVAVQCGRYTQWWLVRGSNRCAESVEPTTTVHTTCRLTDQPTEQPSVLLKVSGTDVRECHLLQSAASVQRAMRTMCAAG